MGSFASLAGVRVASGVMVIPTYGLWTGDLSLPGDQPIPTDGALVFGNLSMQCHVYRSSIFAGSIRARVVGGAGGWRNPVTARQYALDSGVKLSLVLKDAAAEVGEQVNVPNDITIGPGFVRESGPASRVLRQLAGSDWYVDKDGVTQIASWPGGAVPSPFTVMDQDGAKGEIQIATEDYASWMPLTTFEAPTLDGTLTNGGTMFRFDDDGTIRLFVLTAGGTR